VQLIIIKQIVMPLIPNTPRGLSILGCKRRGRKMRKEKARAGNLERIKLRKKKVGLVLANGSSPDAGK
jgi:hypothetical protein